jgi:hypothetical protein
MSSDKIAIATLEEFMKKVRLSRRSNQKEIKMSLDELENVVYNINILMLRVLDKNQEQEEKNKKEDVIVIGMDGGNFNN